MVIADESHLVKNRKAQRTQVPVTRALQVVADEIAGIILICTGVALPTAPLAPLPQKLQGLLSSATRVLLLSGTPALARPEELYPQVCALQVKSYVLQVKIIIFASKDHTFCK